MEMNKKPHKQTISITGLVIPMSWDAEGNITALKLSSFDECEYKIGNFPRERNYINLIGKQYIEAMVIFMQDTSPDTVNVVTYIVVEHPHTINGT